MPIRRPKLYHTSKDDLTQPRLKRDEISDQTILKDFLIDMLKGVSMYAHRARRFSLTDREIDLFATDAFNAAVSPNSIHINRVQVLLKGVQETRNRAKTLYQWACELYGRKPEVLSGDAIREIPTTPEETIQKARRLQEIKTSKAREIIYWERVCTQKLGRLSSLATYLPDGSVCPCDIYGFLHDTLNALSQNPDKLSLVVLKRKIEQAHHNLAKALVAGDTLTDVPLTSFCVSMSEFCSMASDSPGEAAAPAETDAAV